MIEKIIGLTEKLIELTSEESFENLSAILKYANISESEQQLLSQLINEKACINLHFHPDRYSADGFIIEGLLNSGEYKNQFQTKTSSGSLTATTGGDRDKWENALFHNLYDTNMKDRPKYGALNLTHTSDGASPRFGSCYFVTKPQVKNRSTFTYGDSHLLPKERGTINNFRQIFLKLYEDIFTRNSALGGSFGSLSDFITTTSETLKRNTVKEHLSHNLDFYIETQIHGKVDLKKDISTLVLDYSFKGTEFENYFLQISEKFNILLVWNLGYQLNERDFPDNFRGKEVPDFAKQIAKNGIVNAYILGKAISNSKLKLEYGETALFQFAKYIWHCLVKFGKPIKPVEDKGLA